MSILDQFKAFVTERHNIYLRRVAGKPAPWTDDPMLREYKFTNIYRELDRTTVWCKKNVRDKYADHSYANLAWSIIAFRFFNRIETGEAIFNSGAWDQYLKSKDTSILRNVILKMRGKGPYTTGAYIIKTVNGKNKLDGALWAIDHALPVAIELAEYAEAKGYFLSEAQEILLKAPYLGSFMAAQLIADMKYTKLFPTNKVEDWHTWAASGPGSRRGLNILNDADIEHPWREKEWLAELGILRNMIIPMFEEYGWEIPHAQDVQNMLCEFSKYQRGYSRNKFVPSK